MENRIKKTAVTCSITFGLITASFGAMADSTLPTLNIDSHDPRWQQAMQRGLDSGLDALHAENTAQSPAPEDSAEAAGFSEFLEQYTRSRLAPARGNPPAAGTAAPRLSRHPSVREDPAEPVREKTAVGIEVADEFRGQPDALWMIRFPDAY